MGIDKKQLEKLYRRYNKREYISPDPLEYAYVPRRKADREVLAFVASALAYGRVSQILKSVSVVNEAAPSITDFLLNRPPRVIRTKFEGFKHRFTKGENLADFLIGIRAVLRKHGSLNSCFLEGYSTSDETIIPAATEFVEALGGPFPTLLPSPKGKSACKRLNLFLRWMVRADDVDPGLWRGVDKSQLVIPLDTHMHKISVALGLTSRKAGDLRTAIEITESFRAFSPKDPTKYDFSLTRFGIRDELSVSAITGAGR